MDSKSNRGDQGIVRVRAVDRLDALVSHPKRLVVAIVALLVAVGAAVGSSAVLTSSSTNPGNSFQASNLNVSSDHSTVIDASALHPGDNTSGTLTISNDGDLPASSMKLSSADLQDTGPVGAGLASKLSATIPDTTNGGNTQVYSGPASPLTNEPITLDGDPVTPGSPWTAGEQRTYSISLHFDNNANNDYQLSN